MSNFISERYEESHEHLEGTCVESHKRSINDKVYIFTRVSMRSGISRVSAYKKSVVFDRSHSIGFKQEYCHCGKPVHYYEDGFSRGLCLDCSTVRCDVEIGACK